jgi:hypothetical protein
MRTDCYEARTGAFMRKFLLVGIFCTVAACTNSAVKDAVLEDLIDPESARFGEISYSKDGNHACVEVNAKNRMGGYTGDQQMFVDRADGEWTAGYSLDISHDQCVRMINEKSATSDNST